MKRNILTVTVLVLTVLAAVVAVNPVAAAPFDDDRFPALERTIQDMLDDMQRQFNNSVTSNDSSSSASNASAPAMNDTRVDNETNGTNRPPERMLPPVQEPVNNTTFRDHRHRPARDDGIPLVLNNKQEIDPGRYDPNATRNLHVERISPNTLRVRLQREWDTAIGLNITHARLRTDFPEDVPHIIVYADFEDPAPCGELEQVETRPGQQVDISLPDDYRNEDFEGQIRLRARTISDYGSCEELTRGIER